jgi:hypothetical protein
MGQRFETGAESLKAGSMQCAQPTEQRRCSIKNRPVSRDCTID